MTNATSASSSLRASVPTTVGFSRLAVVGKYRREPPCRIVIPGVLRQPAPPEGFGVVLPTRRHQRVPVKHQQRSVRMRGSAKRRKHVQGEVDLPLRQPGSRQGRKTGHRPPHSGVCRCKIQKASQCRGRVPTASRLQQVDRLLEDFRQLDERGRIHAQDLPVRRGTLDPPLASGNRQALPRTIDAAAPEP